MEVLHNKEIINFINAHSNLFWYTPEEKKEHISTELLLETILNYGTLRDSLILIDLIGHRNALQILKKAKGRKKMNYYPEIYNFFTLYLNKIVQRSTK